MNRSPRRWLTTRCLVPRASGLSPREALAPRGAQVPDPITLDHRLSVDAALRILGEHGQAVAFVELPLGRSGIVPGEDLRFAREWAGPLATVAHAVTQAVVDTSCDAPSAVW